MTLTVDEAGRALADPRAYADDRRLHESLALLRRESPVHWVERDGYNPFWGITRHADVMEIERDHAKFRNVPRPMLGTAEFDAFNRDRQEQGIALRTLIHMDDPDHRVIRAVGADWFRPKAMRALEPRIRELARRYVDRMVEHGGECDFAQQVAVHFPLYVILSLLGLPESDFDRMLKLTQELFGGDDSELQRGATNEEKLAVLLDFFSYFQKLTEARRAQPTDDLASAIANAKIDGTPLNDFDTASYYVIIATAGHDTTSSTIAGGLHALMEHPDQLDRLRGDPALMPLAVDEMIRWVTPVKEFMRTAAEDHDLNGTRIRAGDSVLLSYPSANRDEAVFDDPFRFDVGRDPNRHLAFGFGVHYCLGAALARIEVRAFFEELLPRLESIELAGTPESIATTFVGGLKRLPVRYTLTS
ncbi:MULTISPECIES: cytochrome P450 [Thermomonosporaceae]|uniref:cytochrome P450 n=1 Tax=Thermomonosporaceae TaxID=2012 RepID=UPI00255AA97A|nr:MULTISPECIES: cytochrome P450 [Thermomonosporaceae]MDL4773755.1 cytochrome P450 [Actinomadura xylanilytica]